MDAWPLAVFHTGFTAQTEQNHQPVLTTLKRLIILTWDNKTYCEGHAYNNSITWMILMNDNYPVWSQSKIKLMFYPSVKIYNLYLT